MDGLIAAHAQLERKSNLTKALADVEKLIETLQNTRDTISAHPEAANLQVAKLKTPIKQSFGKIEDDLKEVNKGLNQYQKALREKFKNTDLPTSGLGGGEGAEDGGSAKGGLESQSGLVDRAIAMHLLREGKFNVASTFVREVDARRSHAYTEEAEGDDEMDGVTLEGAGQRDIQQQWIEEFQTEPATCDDSIMSDADDDEEDLYGLEASRGGSARKGQLQKRFAEMYHILDALRNQHNLQPAIDWAHTHSDELEARGSNLEFELSRLKFVELYSSTAESSDSDLNGPVRALEYARTVFSTFSTRYVAEIASLLGSLAFSPDLDSSPYNTLFTSPSTYTSVSASFTNEYCALLSLPSASPLYTATTAGAIALPILTKLNRIITQTRGQWTSVNELPVETPLPRSFLFHSVFVCPVSKEQATDTNPPVMLPCGHVIAQESLDAHARGKGRVKCPYCPQECMPRDAKTVFI